MRLMWGQESHLAMPELKVSVNGEVDNKIRDRFFSSTTRAQSREEFDSSLRQDLAWLGRLGNYTYTGLVFKDTATEAPVPHRFSRLWQLAEGITKESQPHLELMLRPVKREVKVSTRLGTTGRGVLELSGLWPRIRNTFVRADGKISADTEGYVEWSGGMTAPWREKWLAELTAQRDRNALLGASSKPHASLRVAPASVFCTTLRNDAGAAWRLTGVTETVLPLCEPATRDGLLPSRSAWDIPRQSFWVIGSGTKHNSTGSVEVELATSAQWPPQVTWTHSIRRLMYMRLGSVCQLKGIVAAKQVLPLTRPRKHSDTPSESVASFHSLPLHRRCFLGGAGLYDSSGLPGFAPGTVGGCMDQRVKYRPGQNNDRSDAVQRQQPRVERAIRSFLGSALSSALGWQDQSTVRSNTDSLGGVAQFKAGATAEFKLQNYQKLNLLPNSVFRRVTPFVWAQAGLCIPYYDRHWLPSFLWNPNRATGLKRYMEVVYQRLSIFAASSAGFGFSVNLGTQDQLAAPMGIAHGEPSSELQVTWAPFYLWPVFHESRELLQMRLTFDS